MSGEQVLVTGAAGGIGMSVVTELASSGFEVAGLDRRQPPEPTSSLLCDFVLGEASDASAVTAACTGVDAVVHLAAIPSPVAAEDVVFDNNVRATYTVLDAAARARVSVAVVASSTSVLGLVYAPRRCSPRYVPIDEEHPIRASDPYALAKQCDENISAMHARRYGMTTLAYRFPYTTTADRISARAAQMRTDPRSGERESWAYLDVRDAARAVRLGLRAALDGKVEGFELLNIVTDDAMIDGPLELAVRKFHPDAEVRRPLGQRRSAFTVTKAQQLIGFHALHRRAGVAP